MTRIAAVFRRSDRGTFSHFAHFVCDFAIPLYALLRKHDLLLTLAEKGLTLDLENRRFTQFGPMLPFVSELFPNLGLHYLSRFECEPERLAQQPWCNEPQGVQHFLEYVTNLLHIKPQSFGVIVVNRGTDHTRYPGGSFNQKSGADRRRIRGGYEALFEAVSARRPDCAAVVLEELSLADQISIFLKADTLIAQHGAAFVHGQWMPPGGHLIELQCLHPQMFPHFVECIAATRGHKRSVIYVPCSGHRRDLSMTIDNPNQIAELLTPSNYHNPEQRHL